MRDVPRMAGAASAPRISFCKVGAIVMSRFVGARTAFAGWYLHRMAGCSSICNCKLKAENRTLKPETFSSMAA